MKTKKVKRYVKALRERQHASERAYWNAPDGDRNLQHFWSTASTLRIIADEMDRKLLGREPDDSTDERLASIREARERGMR